MTTPSTTISRMIYDQSKPLGHRVGAALQKPRVPVTLEWWAKWMDPDKPVWRFDEDAYSLGLECWFEIEPEQTIDPGYHFFVSPNCDMTVGGDYTAYVQYADLPRFRFLSWWARSWWRATDEQVKERINLLPPECRQWLKELTK